MLEEIKKTSMHVLVWVMNVWHIQFRAELGEIDYHDNRVDLDEMLVNILKESECILEISTEFEF